VVLRGSRVREVASASERGMHAATASSVARKKSYEERYTHPELRAAIKEELQRSSKGGRPGQWSARKSQLLVKEYERRGGGYREGANRDEARSLHAWTEQEWQTRDGQAKARRGKRMKRYLPKEAWERLSPEERARAERTKGRADRRGAQRAAWPGSVQGVMRELDRETHRDAETKSDLYVRAKELGVPGRSRMTKDQLRRAIRRAERER
jgi:hypothetical protein